MTALRTVYERTLPHCALGDWDLGYKQQVEAEDGLGALLHMCSCSGGAAAPVLPLYVLMRAVSEDSGPEMHLTRMGHVLNKLGSKCGSFACSAFLCVSC